MVNHKHSSHKKNKRRRVGVLVLIMFKSQFLSQECLQMLILALLKDEGACDPLPLIPSKWTIQNYLLGYQSELFTLIIIKVLITIYVPLTLIAFYQEKKTMIAIKWWVDDTIWEVEAQSCECGNKSWWFYFLVKNFR